MRSIVLFVMTPLIIWALAFLIWFYWYDITGRDDKIPPAKASKEVEHSIRPTDQSTKERIGEEDRRKLDEILKSKK